MGRPGSLRLLALVGATSLTLGGVVATLTPGAAAATSCSSHAVADANGDGWSEYAVATTGNHGVKVFDGTPTGLRIEGTFVLGRSGVPAGAGLVDSAGSFGDVNGNGCADLVMLTRAAAGSPDPSFVVLDGVHGTGITTAGATSFDLASLTSCGTCVPDAHAFALGDVNGDGFDDLEVAVSLDNASHDHVQDELVVVPGSSSGLQPTKATIVDGSAGLHLDPDQVITGLAAADFNGDRRSDLAVAFRTQGDGRVRPGVQVVYGSAQGLGQGRASQTWNREVPGVPGDDGFGTTDSVASGDFNGDRRSDLALGQSDHVTVLYGSTAGLTTRDAQDFSQQTPGIAGSRSPIVDWGDSLATGDFSGDADAELIVGDFYATGTMTILPGSRTQGLTAAHSVLWSIHTPGMPDASHNRQWDPTVLSVGSFGWGPGQDLVLAQPYAPGDKKADCLALYGSTTRQTGLRTTHRQLFGAPDGCNGATTN